MHTPPCTRLQFILDQPAATEPATAANLEEQERRPQRTPSTRINAWRLLARCRAANADAARACEALEQAVAEARVARYVYMERRALEDMLGYVPDDKARRRVRNRIVEARP